MGRLSQYGKLGFICGMLIFGSYDTLNLKWQFQTCVGSIPAPTLAQASVTDGCPEGQKHFNKPWAQNWFMFWGEFGILPVAFIQQRNRAARRASKGKLPRPPDKASFWVFVIPSFCDVLGSGLGGAAMMFVSASVWQMMRGSIVIFTSFLTVVWLKKRLMTFHWIGVGFTMAGLVCVGYAAIADASLGGSGSDPALGIGLVLIAQLTSSFQGVFEEHLTQGLDISAARTVGLEGFWGIILQGVMCLAFTHIPGPDHGKIEYLPDSRTMYESSFPIDMLTLKYMISIALYNFCGLNVTKNISAITRCLVDSCRTMIVWFVSLAFFYGFNGQFRAYGTPWTSNSWIQGCGFCFLIAGTLVYNSVIKLPGLNYHQDMQDMPPLAVWSPTNAPTKGLDSYEFLSPASPAATPLSYDAPLLQSNSRTTEEKLEF